MTGLTVEEEAVVVVDQRAAPGSGADATGDAGDGRPKALGCGIGANRPETLVARFQFGHRPAMLALTFCCG